MNDRQENRLSSNESLNDYFEVNNAVWVGNAAFAASVSAFVANLEKIRIERDLQMHSITGYALEKAEKKKELCEVMMFVISRMRSYAAAMDNVGLLGNLHYSYSKLFKMRDNLLGGIVTDVVGIANVFIVELSTYDILPTTLTNLSALYDAYFELLSKPRIAIAERKGATERLADLFEESSRILEMRLDLDIEVLKDSYPVFYDGYWNIRYIVDNHGRKVQIRGVVKDLLTGGAIKSVTLNLLSEGLSVKSSKFGVFSLKGLEPKTYEIEVLKKGYKPKLLANIKVEADKLTKISIGMEKENSLQTFQTGAVVSIASGATINQLLSPGISGLNNLVKLSLTAGGPIKISSSKIAGVHNNLLALMMNAGEQAVVTMSEIGEEGSMNLVMTNYGTVAASVNVQPGILQLLR